MSIFHASSALVAYIFALLFLPLHGQARRANRKVNVQFLYNFPNDSESVSPEWLELGQSTFSKENELTQTWSTSFRFFNSDFINKAFSHMQNEDSRDAKVLFKANFFSGTIEKGSEILQLTTFFPLKHFGKFESPVELGATFIISLSRYLIPLSIQFYPLYKQQMEADVYSVLQLYLPTIAVGPVVRSEEFNNLRDKAKEAEPSFLQKYWVYIAVAFLINVLLLQIWQPPAGPESSVVNSQT